MLRNTILLLVGGLFLNNPLMAQSDCCDKVSESSCDSATVATTVSQDEPSALAKGLAAIPSKRFAFDVKVSATEGEGNATSVTGHLAFGDAKHFAVKMNIEAKMGDEVQKINVRMTGDGKFLYADMPNPMGGEGNQLIKVDMKVLEQAFALGVQQSPIPVFDKKGAINASAIDNAMNMVGMTIEKNAEAGTITLSMKEPGKEDGGTAKIVLDAKTYLPKSLHMAERKDSVIKATFSNTKLYKDLASFGENYFTFAVPEGAMVQDMTPMVQMMLAQMGGNQGGEEELEF